MARGSALLLLMLSLSMVAASLLIYKFKSTRQDELRTVRSLQKLAQAQEALMGYAITHGRLPRPAQSASEGREAATICQNEQECTGILPWATLGLANDDGWGKLLRYSVSPSFVRAPMRPVDAHPDRRVWTRDSIGQRILIAGYDGCENSGKCIAAVIISTGKYNLGTALNGLSLANGATDNIDEIQNSTGNNDFVSRTVSDQTEIPGGAFDDHIVVVPAKKLLLRMNAAGVLY